jgi:quinol monooxygenase YgiN
LEDFKNAVAEEMRRSIAVEPGVLAIYCVADRDAANRLRFFEIYASDAAYAAHRESPHFKKYIDVTKAMVRSKRLLEVDPVLLAKKQ